MKNIIYILSILFITSCGFEDNLPCKSSECENIPLPPSDSDNEG